MDNFDRAILREVQRDSSRSISELSEKVSLSSSATHRRLKVLEAEGAIVSYGARIDPKIVGRSLLAFVDIQLDSQGQDRMDEFENAVGEFDDILECHLVSGDADYFLRVAARDVDDYNEIHRKCLSRLPGVSSMKTSFALKCAKPWLGYNV